MADQALDAQGTKIYVGDTGSPNQFVEIPEVRSLRGPDGSASWMDTTDLSSTAKEGRPGLPDNGSVRLSIHYVPDNTVHNTLRTAFGARTKKQFAIDFTDTAPVTRWEFSGYVTGFSVSGEVDGILMADVTIRVTEAITQS